MKPQRIKANLSVKMKEFLRNKAVIFWIIMFPILLILLFGFIFQEEGKTVYNLPVQNRDNGWWSAQFLEALNETGMFNVKMVDPNVNPDTYVRDNNENIILIIPEGFSEQINHTLAARHMGRQVNTTVNLTVMYDPSVSVTQNKIQLIASVVHRINNELAGTEDTITIEPKTTLSDHYRFIDFFTPGIIAMAVMTSSLFDTVSMNTELKQKGVLRKLATTPITRGEWLVSYFLYQLFIALLSTTAILTVGVAVFDLHFQLNSFLPLFIVLDVFAFSGIGMLIAGFVKEAESANAAANAVMFPMMFLSGTFFPLEIMPDFLQHIARILPLYYVNGGLRDSMVYLNFTRVWFNATIIGAFGFVAFISGIFLTSWKEE